MAGGPRWTEKEDLAIRERYPLLGSKLELPGRKPIAIRTRAMNLGVRFTFSRDRERKTCTRCQCDLSATDFRRRERQGTVFLNATCRPCDAAMRREVPAEHRREVDHTWRENNPEKVRGYQKINRERHREKRSAAYKRWYLNNREEQIERTKRHIREHRDAHNRTRRRHYRANLEVSRRKAREAYRKNPEPIKLANTIAHRKRRAIKAGVEATLTRVEWEAIKMYYDHRCAYCFDKPARLTQDHVKPISKGGAHAADNVVPACRFCNSSKNDRDLLDWLDL